MVDVVRAETEPPKPKEKQEKITAALTPFGTLLSNAFKIYQENFVRVICLIGIALASSVPILFVFGLYFLAGSVLDARSTVLHVVNMSLVVIGFLGMLFLIYMNVVTQASVYVLLKEGDKYSSVRQLLKEGRTYFWKLLLVNFSVGIFVLLWSLLFVIPGIIMAVFYSMAIYVLVFEGFESTYALKRSRELVRGNWWSLVWRLLLFSVLIWIFFLVLSIPIWFMPEEALLTQVWTWIVNIIGMIITPLGIFFSYQLYRDLRQAKGESILSVLTSRRSKVMIIVATVALFLFFVIPVVVAVFLSDSRTQVQDAKRLTDAKLVQTALELYKLDIGIYPENLIWGEKLTFGDKVYLEQLPENAVGTSANCPAYVYRYSSVEEGDSYQLEFCLEQDYQGYTAGYHILSPQEYADIYDALDDYVGVSDDGLYAYILLPDLEQENCMNVILYPTGRPDTELADLYMCSDEVRSLKFSDGWLELTTNNERTYRLEVESGTAEFKDSKLPGSLEPAAL